MWFSSVSSTVRPANGRTGFRAGQLGSVGFESDDVVVLDLVLFFCLGGIIFEFSNKRYVRSV